MLPTEPVYLGSTLRSRSCRATSRNPPFRASVSPSRKQGCLATRLTELLLQGPSERLCGAPLRQRPAASAAWVCIMAHPCTSPRAFPKPHTRLDFSFASRRAWPPLSRLTASVWRAGTGFYLSFQPLARHAARSWSSGRVFRRWGKMLVSGCVLTLVTWPAHLREDSQPRSSGQRRGKATF